MNLQPRRPPGRADEPFRHLIDEYKHRAQTVTCTCGWHGSSASPDGRTSEWKEHLAATRIGPTSSVAKTVPTTSAPKSGATSAATRAPTSAATRAPTGAPTSAATPARAAASAKAGG